ncbi:MAG: rhodanese-like domain-containing protein [Anaerolineales bacterium]|jgi:rhodanese-related sulfurtransferase|nr:rhodanese-like domain-containing protein [Chloroflexota bacterium]MBK6646499.1 rhodanese-like domain-containing protein [Anaerolineales bacterium]
MGFLSGLFGPAVPSITAEELNEKLKFGKHPLVLDVRQPDEFRSGHIAGAKLIPLNELQRKMGELPKGREIVCICASGNRSTSAAKMLAKEGFNALNVSGGMLAWRRAKLPVQN